MPPSVVCSTAGCEVSPYLVFLVPSQLWDPLDPVQERAGLFSIANSESRVCMSRQGALWTLAVFTALMVHLMCEPPGWGKCPIAASSWESNFQPFIPAAIPDACRFPSNVIWPGSSCHDFLLLSFSSHSPGHWVLLRLSCSLQNHCLDREKSTHDAFFFKCVFIYMKSRET